MKKRYYAVIIVLAVSVVAIWGEFLWLTSTVEGINFMIEKQGFIVQTDYAIGAYSVIDERNATILGYTKWLNNLKANSHLQWCCPQSEYYWKSKNPTVHCTFNPWKYGSDPEFTVYRYWYYDLPNGTRYMWNSWDGNHP